jgi:hypothetical protein
MVYVLAHMYFQVVQTWTTEWLDGNLEIFFSKRSVLTNSNHKQIFSQTNAKNKWSPFLSELCPAYT